MSEDNGGWIEWHGGECPVEPETTVEMRFFTPSGATATDWDEAGAYDWSHGGIIAYRLVQP